METPKPKTSVKRIGGYLHRVVPIADSAGKVVNYALKPLMVEFHPRDLMQVIVGASILAVPVAMTEETWVLGSAVSDFHVHVKFDDGDSTASLNAEELPLSQNRLYDLSGPAGGAKQRMEFVALTSTPDNAEDLAVMLADNGCTGQLDLLSDKLAS